MLYQQHYITPAAETPTAASGGMMSSLFREGEYSNCVSFRINDAALVWSRDSPTGVQTVMCEVTDTEAWDLLGGQRVDVPDLPGHGHGVAVDDVEVLFTKQQQTLAGVQTLNPGTAVHVLNLEQWREETTER